MHKIKKTRKLPPQSSGHPYEEWVNEMRTLEEDEYLELMQGVHFECSLRSFKQQIWRWARRNDVQIVAREVHEPGRPPSVCCRLA